MTKKSSKGRNNAESLIASECNKVRELLLAKNREYGNSALEPSNIFSNLTAEEQIDVRIDDKLKRLQTLKSFASRGEEVVIVEDTELDLIGYLVLKRVARIWTAKEND